MYNALGVGATVMMYTDNKIGNNRNGVTEEEVEKKTFPTTQL